MYNTESGSLADLGWDSFFESNYQERKLPGSIPCRVAFEYKYSYRVYTGDGDIPASISGRMHYTLNDGFPAVGDWVVVVPFPDGSEGIIHDILPRKSKFSRKASGPKEVEQIVAANVDTVFIVSALDGQNFNLRRLERYLTMAWKSGASPVMVLNKADLCPDIDTVIRETESIASGIPVHVVSATEKTGLAGLRQYTEKGTTTALLGSSGVGKSALINALLGTERLATGANRTFDGKGRHTTTRRELVPLPGGGLLLDTPGMKIISMWGNEGDISDSFEDIEGLMTLCRFSDCRHESEPGCAVKEALETGELAPGRYQSYLKLRKELRHMAMREDDSIRKEEDLKWKNISKLQKKLKKHKFKDR